MKKHIQLLTLVLAFNTNVSLAQAGNQPATMVGGGSSHPMAIDTNIVNGETKIDNYFFQGQKDAKTYYKHSLGASWSTFGVGLISPLVALIPAIATSAVTPKPINLNYPNASLFKNEEYRKGYTLKAKRLKQGRVWGSWGASLALAIVVQSIKYSKDK